MANVSLARYACSITHHKQAILACASHFLSGRFGHLSNQSPMSKIKEYLSNNSNSSTKYSPSLSLAKRFSTKSLVIFAIIMAGITFAVGTQANKKKQPTEEEVLENALQKEVDDLYNSLAQGFAEIRKEMDKQPGSESWK